MAAPSDDDAFLIDRRDGVLTLTFNRPEQGNATPTAAVPLLTAVFREACDDRGVRCILIEGRGRHFCSGGNLATFASEIARGSDALVSAFATRLANLAELVEAVIAFDRPIVAAVHGAVAGAGLFYALAADWVTADDTAVFIFAHQRMGLSPDGGVSWLLPRIVGLRQARQLLFRAARTNAADAERLGLISERVAADLLDKTAWSRATEFAAAPQCAMRNAKRLTGAALSASLSDHLRAEGQAVIACVANADFAEGVNSFLEKRPARFPSIVAGE